MISKINSMGNYHVSNNFNKKRNNNIPMRDEVKTISFEGANIEKLNKLYSPKKMIMPILFGALTVLPMQKSKADIIGNNNEIEQIEEVKLSKINSRKISEADVTFANTIVQANQKINNIAIEKLNKILDKMHEDTNEKYQEELKNFVPEESKKAGVCMVVCTGVGTLGGGAAGFVAGLWTGPGAAATTTIGAMKGAGLGALIGGLISGGSAYKKARKIYNLQTTLVKIGNLKYELANNGKKCPPEERAKLFPDATLIEKVAKISGGGNLLEITSTVSAKDIKPYAKELYPDNFAQVVKIEGNKTLYTEIDLQKFDGKFDNGTHPAIKVYIIEE